MIQDSHERRRLSVHPCRAAWRLRNFAGVTLVDAMLSYYQVTLGGMSGRGNIASADVYLCLGDSGAGLAGGVDSVRQHLKLYLK